MFFYAWVIIAHWEFWYDYFICLIDISIWDIDMLMILIDSLACLSKLIWFLPWLSCSLWHVCPNYCISCLSWCWLSCLYIIMEHATLGTYSSWVSYFLISWSVDLDYIYLLCMIAWCTTALFLYDACIACLCESHTYPLISNFLVSIDLISLDLIFHMRLVALFVIRPS